MSSIKSRKNADLTPAMTYILLVLVSGAKHGYGIMTEISDITKGQFQIGPGTLYRSISQMLDRKLIEEANESVEQIQTDDRRKYYRITDSGRLVIQNEVKRLETIVREADRKGIYQTLEGF